MFDSCRRDIHYLRLSVTDRCNLRCRYCMPDGAKIPEHEEVLTHEEFLRLAALFAQCGIDTVRVTGGEPLVRKSVAQLVAGLKATPGIRHVSMTTNGTLLAQQLPALLDAGLDSVNISLDTLDPAVFRHITARDEFAAVQAGLRAALESPLPVKLNCVPQVGVNEGELEAIAALARDNDLQVRFIEMMPIGYGAAMPCVSGPELRARFANRWPELHPVEGTTFGNGPAVYYTVPGWKGSIGFIAAVHGKFCVSCNRVRLTSQGFLRPCLPARPGVTCVLCCAAGPTTPGCGRPSGRPSGPNPGSIILRTGACPRHAACTASEDNILWVKFWPSAQAPGAAPSRPRCPAPCSPRNGASWATPTAAIGTARSVC